MIRRGTWIVLVVFILLLGVAFYLSKNPLPESTDANATPSPTALPLLIESWQSTDIVSMEYKGEAGLVTLDQNPDGSWTVGPDNGVPATIGQVENLLAQLATARLSSTLDTSNPLDAIGLAAPAQVLTLRNTQGQQLIIHIGKTTPTGSGYYVQVNNNAPVVVNKYTLDAVLELLSRENLAALTPTPELLPLPDEVISPVTTPTP